MKLDFFVVRATSKTFKIVCLYSQGHLTFERENPTIRIAAKFQYKIPSLGTLYHHYGLSLLWILYI